MQAISDILLAAAAIGAAVYCLALSLRLRRFDRLEGGMGSAIAVLSGQVDDLTRVLDLARNSASGSARQLEALTDRAETAAQRLELMLASLHDLPGIEEDVPRRRGLRRRVRATGLEAVE